MARDVNKQVLWSLRGNRLTVRCRYIETVLLEAQGRVNVGLVFILPRNKIPARTRLECRDHATAVGATSFIRLGQGDSALLWRPPVIGAVGLMGQMGLTS